MTKVGSRLFKPITTTPTSPTDVVSKSYSDGYVTNNAITTVNDILTNKINIDSSLDYSIVGTTAIIKSVRKEVLFKPSGTSDDGARLQTLADSLINTGYTVVLAPGTYRQTVEIHPHHGHPNIKGNKNVRWICNQSRVASQPTPAAFYFSASYTGSDTTLYSAAAVNDLKLTVTSITNPPIVKGSFIELAGSTNNFGSIYHVTGTPTINGSAYDVPIDRPIRVVSPSGSVVKLLADWLEDWEFDGGGMQMSGATCRYFSLSRSLGCKIKNITFDDADGYCSDLGSYDNCGSNNLFENIQYKMANGTTPITGGLLCETNEGTIFKNNNIQFGVGSPVPALAMDSSIGCKSENSKWSAVTISCEQANIALENEIIGGTTAFLKFGQTNTTNIPVGTKISNVSFIGQPGGVWANYVYPTVPTLRTVFENCTFNLPLTRGYGVNLLQQPQEMKFFNCTFTANRTSFVGLAQADVPVGIGPGPSTAHTISLDSCTFTDCEAVTSTSNATTFKLTANNCSFSMQYVGSAAICLFRLYGTTVNARFTNCTGIIAGGAYSGIIGATTGTYLFTDCDIVGTWLTVGGTTTGYKRGQTSLTTSGGTFTTTAW